MQKITIDKDYHVPTSWADVTLSRFIEWLNMPEPVEPDDALKSLSFRTGVPMEVLGKCDMASLSLLNDLAGFWYDLEVLEAYNTVPKEFAEAVDFGKLPYGKLTMIEQKIKECDDKGLHPFTVAAECMRIYFEPQDFEKMDGAFGLAHYLWQRASFHFRWKRSLEIIHTKNIRTIYGKVAFFLQNYAPSPSSGND